MRNTDQFAAASVAISGREKRWRRPPTAGAVGVCGRSEVHGQFVERDSHEEAGVEIRAPLFREA